MTLFGTWGSRSCSAKTMFSNALSRGRRRCSWKMNATSRRSPPRPRRHRRWRPVPRTHSSPALGRSWPWTRRSRVVLPEPLGPAISNSSPWPTVRLMPFRTRVLPYALETPTSLTAGSGATAPLTRGRPIPSDLCGRAASAPLPFWDVRTRPEMAGRLPTLFSRLAHARSEGKLISGGANVLRTAWDSAAAAAQAERRGRDRDRVRAAGRRDKGQATSVAVVRAHHKHRRPAGGDLAGDL